MLFDNKRKRIERVLTQLVTDIPFSAFKSELNRTISFIETGHYLIDQPIIGDFTPRLIMSQDNWKFNPKVIHVLASLTMAEVIHQSVLAHNIKPKHFTRDLRRTANDMTAPIFERLFREQVGNDEFEQYKLAHPNEF